MQMDFIKTVFANAKCKFLFTFSSGAAKLQRPTSFFFPYLFLCLFNFIIGIHCDCLQQIFSNFIRPSLKNLRANIFFIDF